MKTPYPPVVEEEIVYNRKLVMTNIDKDTVPT
jgi:hypothetical protein